MDYKIAGRNMEFYLKGKIIKDTDNDAIYHELSSIAIPVTAAIKAELIEIFNHTSDCKARDKIALIFADLADKSIVPVLVRKIGQIKYSKHISTLIYACSEYDCVEWVVFFVNLIIDLDDSSYLEAISVIEEIRSPIILSDKIICVDQLTKHLLTIGKESNKYRDIESVIELIENMATVGAVLD
jgi:hypothetical protein